MQFDLSQAELRGLGSFTHDKTLKNAYDNGMDLHTYTAANMFCHGDMEAVTKHQRQVAKTVNFSIVYGAQANTVARNAGIPISEAADALEKWFSVYSGVKPWMQSQWDSIDDNGYVVGLWGLKRRLPLILANEADGADLKRQGGNAPIQNFASDFNCFLILLIMDEVVRAGYRQYIKIVNTVHDSIVFEVTTGYESTVAQFYYQAMDQMNAWCSELIGEEYYIRMRGDLEIGLNYGDMVGCKVNPDTYEVVIEEE